MRFAIPRDDRSDLKTPEKDGYVVRPPGKRAFHLGRVAGLPTQLRFPSVGMHDICFSWIFEP
jgi:hypothetical protein